ncbi:MAG TPA: hypothetical protein VF173_30525 [Thermoanaerobaculia bacterium]|nr:hypothetical protein [Thermoanaerobaculia bacterium]
MKRSQMLVCCALVLLMAVPALAARPVRLASGVDFWQTLSSGATGYSFASNPIPAGFFCAKSAPFTGTVYFEGVPLHSDPAGILGSTDTIIERLDEATFDANGIARTRIRGRALNLVATEPVKTSCGSFKVTANLTNDQPVSPMVFHRLNPAGGTFSAQLKLRVQINFTHLASNKTFAIVRDVNLPTVNEVPFAMGVAATACLSTATTPVQVEDVRLDDGKPIVTRDRSSVAQKVTAIGETGPVERTPVGVEPAQPVATGCYCNPVAPFQCLPTYSWHNPCATPGYDCEKHFTTRPCDLGYTSQCTTTTTTQSLSDQLQILYDRGYLLEKPAVALQKQLRSASQVEKDQAARDRELHRQQQ